MLSALRWLPLRYAWGNYWRTVERHITSAYLQRIFLRYPTYVGSSPYRSPATLIIIPYLEFAFGGWYIEGGLYRIVETILAALQRYGAEVVCRTNVRRIVHQNGKVVGVELEGAILPVQTSLSSMVMLQRSTAFSVGQKD